MQKVKLTLFGLLTGILNGMLGAGGGMIILPILEKSGLSAKEAHATSVSVILPITVISAVFYLLGGQFAFSQAAWYVPFGVVGAVIGAKLLPRMSSNALHKIFGSFILYAAGRLIFT